MTIFEKIDALAALDLPAHEAEFIARMKAAKDLDVPILATQVAYIGLLYAEHVKS